MTHHAVTLGVKPCLRVECKFWLEDDGWNGISEQPAIAVQAGTFEEAKSDMEIALGKYIESLLREGRASAEQAADPALLVADWRFHGTAADGSDVATSGTNIEVARRQPDGNWRYLIDLPYGLS